MSLQYMVRGKLMDEGEFLMTAVKARPVARIAPPKRVEERDKAKLSDGFAVAGFSPAHLVEAEKERASRIAAFERAEAKGEAKGMKRPPPWDAERYMNATRPRRVRSKPYELASAADVCAELARKAGWLKVRVEELMKG